MILGRSDLSLLSTYEAERKKIAQDLIAFDHRFSRLFSGRPAKDVMDEAGISMDEFKEAFEKGNMFASGIAVDYQDSPIVAKTARGVKPKLATNIQLGMRLANQQVLNQADARPWQVQELLKSNGRWRVLLFAGDLEEKAASERLQTLAQKLDAPDSFLKRFTPAGGSYDSVIELLTIHSGRRAEVEFHDIPAVFHPYTETEGWDYWKVFVDDVSYHEGDGAAYDGYGIDKQQGCAVIVRPDGYVSWVGEADDYAAMDTFFSGFMLEASRPKVNGGSGVSDHDMSSDASNGKFPVDTVGAEAIKGVGAL